MKIKITLTLIIASLTVLFAACGNSANTTNTTINANKSNTAVVVNSNQTTAANNTAPSTNTMANTVSNANKAAPTKDDGTIKGEYMVGDVKCTITPDEKDRDLYSKVSCADNRKVETYSRDDDPATKRSILVSENQKSRFVFENNNLASGTFTDEKGKTVKVTRVQ
jgi:hypothetical protein